jgi:Txe/YoeB family toxin of Txe-Axe toxin-antitoxin module
LTYRKVVLYWTRSDRKIALRVLDLVEDVMRSPFEGIGKPETMRFDFARLLVPKGFCRTQTGL